MLSDYITEINVMNFCLKTQTWFLCSRPKVNKGYVLHLIVENGNKLNVYRYLGGGI